MTDDMAIEGMPSIKAVQALTAHLLKFPQIDAQTTHLIHGGMYARTIFIPAGSVLTGATTNLNNICIVSGDITVTTDKGMKRLIGYTLIPANSGYKRAGFAHADTYWTTLFATELTDVREIEDVITDDSDQIQTRRQNITWAQSKQVEVSHGSN